MNTSTYAGKMLEFIKKSPSCFHAVENIKEILLASGFTEINEGDRWELKPQGKYFVSRNGSALIAFIMPATAIPAAFYITAAHSDSPCFKVKENPEMKSAGLVRLNVEKYGGMLIRPWFDRPLSIAGRVVYRESSTDAIKIGQKLVSIDRNLLMIPNLAIHMNRDANDGGKINVQNEVLPLVSACADFCLTDLLASQAEIPAESIIGHDIFLYNRDEPSFWGFQNEFICSPRLDDLECVFTCCTGFVNAACTDSDGVRAFCMFDNEEVGSQSRQGAASTFLKDILHRICLCSGCSEEDYQRAVAKGFLISADNAHAVHPNYVQSADPVNQPAVNGGPVLKFNASQKYTTDGLSAAVFREICRKAGVPCQVYTNNSNTPGGSTLGNISTKQVSICSVDIGLAQWAMHSPMESAGAKDVDYMVEVVKSFYSNPVRT